MDDKENRFDYCTNVDLHILDAPNSIETAVAIAAEHGFRGIVVPISQLEYLVKLLKKTSDDCKILPICILDYPYGSSSQDIRTYSILSAKEKGAKEIEIVAPYHLYQKKDFENILADMKSLVLTANRAGISIKYIIDQNSGFVEDSMKTKLCRMISSSKMPIVSSSSGFFDKDINHPDNILKMRALKSKTNAIVKVFINTINPTEFAMYPKAGADIIGLQWNKAPHVVHAYEDLIENSSK